MNKYRAATGLIAVIATMVYLCTFFTPLKDSLLYELNTVVTTYSAKENTDTEQRKFVSREIYTHFSIPIIANIPIPLTDSKIPISISWHFYEITALLFFLISFTIKETFPADWVKYIPLPEKLSSIIKSAFSSLSAISNIDQIIFLILIIFFLLFASTQIFLRHHGAYLGIYSTTRWFINIAIAATTAAILFSLFRISYTPTSINGRRKFIAKLSSWAVVSALSPTFSEKFFQSISIKHLPRPRYKNNCRVMWRKISVSPGLYQHVKSKKYYYVNSDSEIRSCNEIKESHLIKTKSLALKDVDYENLSKLTASVFFEGWALTLLRQGHLLDALHCLESGCRYEIYRIKQYDEKHPNIRLFKLYAGLCRKNKLKHNLSLLKKEIAHDNKLSNLLQPPPQRWLMTRASCFKQRWMLKKHYNGVSLTSI